MFGSAFTCVIKKKFYLYNPPRLLCGWVSVSLLGFFDYVGERFFKFLPKSEDYSKTHDFNFYNLNPREVRWIGGFGEIAWLKDDFWNLEKPEWADEEISMIAHMNEDHKDVVISCLKGVHNINDETALMIGLSIDGYYIESKMNIYYLPFDNPCLNSIEVREALVEHAKRFKS